MIVTMFGFVICITLPETNISPLKIGHLKRKLVFQPSIFTCELLVQGGYFVFFAGFHWCAGESCVIFSASNFKSPPGWKIRHTDPHSHSDQLNPMILFQWLFFILQIKHVRNNFVYPKLFADMLKVFHHPTPKCFQSSIVICLKLDFPSAFFSGMSAETFVLTQTSWWKKDFVQWLARPPSTRDLAKTAKDL